ncbi:MAG: surface polysaccharide O-acyltransferase-like enzyme [Gammaproteobacteria bacterium]|jgi:surface polysaccharide O-acyltransferase-like enzyme
MVLVIIVHIGDIMFRSDQLGIAEWWMVNISQSFAAVCVPLFVMLSGAIVLQTQKPIEPARYIQTRLIKIGVPLIIWSLIYAAYFHLGSNQGFVVRDVPT